MPPLTDAILRTLVSACVLAALAQPASAAVASDGFARHLAELINDYRQRQGLDPLPLADDLVQLADEHSTRMADRRQLSHDGFRGRAQRASSGTCVENVGWNHPTPEALLDGWRMSPGHHRNLLEPKVARMGIAVSTRYVTFFACR